jgi:hypothetical protein
MASNNKNRENAVYSLLKLSEHPAWSPPPRIKATPKTVSGENKIWVQTPSQGSFGENRYGWISPPPTLSLEGKSRRGGRVNRKTRKTRKISKNLKNTKIRRVMRKSRKAVL